MTTNEIAFNLNGKVVASLRNGVLRRNIRGSKHILRLPPAIAFDRCIIEEARREGCREIEVTDTESDRVYTLDFADFEKHAFPIDRGFGAQLGCELRWWNVRKAGEPAVRQLTFALAGVGYGG